MANARGKQSAFQNSIGNSDYGNQIDNDTKKIQTANTDTQLRGRNDIANVNLEVKQNNAVNHAKNGTPEQQKKADEELIQAELQAKKTADAYTGFLKGTGNIPEAQNVQDNLQRLIDTGRYNVADAYNVGAQRQLTEAQNNAVTAAKTGTAEEQKRAEEALANAEAMATQRSAALAEIQKARGMEELAKNTVETNDTNINNGRYNIAAAYDSVAQEDLASAQTNAAAQARYGTDEQQQKANEELAAAEERATQTSEALAASQRNNGDEAGAKATEDALQNNIYNGRYGVAEAAEARANSDLDNAIRSGDQTRIDNARQEAIERAAATGKLADEAVSAMNNSGNTEGAKAMEERALAGVEYAGSGRTIADKKKNDATVTTAIKISDASVKALEDAKNDPMKDIATIGEKAATDADAVIKAMNDTGNNDKTEEFIKGMQERLGHNGVYDPNKKAGDYVREIVKETETLRVAETAKTNYDTNKNAYDEARTAYELDPMNEDKQRAYEEARDAFLLSASELGTALDNYNTATTATGNQDK